MPPLASDNGARPEIHPHDEAHGQNILVVRKTFAFAGFTHRRPHTISYVDGQGA